MVTRIYGWRSFNPSLWLGGPSYGLRMDGYDYLEEMIVIMTCNPIYEWAMKRTMLDLDLDVFEQ